MRSHPIIQAIVAILLPKTENIKCREVTSNGKYVYWGV